jgi:hypothetical protein
VATECDELGGARCSQARRASLIYAEVRAEATQRGFDAQSKTGGGGWPALMASQQVERAAELQNPEVRAELNWRVRECERKCLPWPTQLDSAGECVCKITGHARAD